MTRNCESRLKCQFIVASCIWIISEIKQASLVRHKALNAVSFISCRTPGGTLFKTRKPIGRPLDKRQTLFSHTSKRSTATVARATAERVSMHITLFVFLNSFLLETRSPQIYVINVFLPTNIQAAFWYFKEIGRVCYGAHLWTNVKTLAKKGMYCNGQVKNFPFLRSRILSCLNSFSALFCGQCIWIRNWSQLFGSMRLKAALLFFSEKTDSLECLKISTRKT